MNFGDALEALKNGHKIKREIWGGYWMLLNNASVEDDDRPVPTKVNIEKLIIAHLKNDGGVSVAQPYQNDLLAEDWQIV